MWFIKEGKVLFFIVMNTFLLLLAQQQNITDQSMSGEQLLPIQFLAILDILITLYFNNT